MMNRFLHIVFAGAMLTVMLAGCSGSRPSTVAINTENPEIRAIGIQYPLLADKPHETERVERIVDGDTFVTASGRKVRLIGVNTPEVTGESRAQGLKASDYAETRLAGQTVVLFSDTGDTDRYGRLLRYVFVDGESVMFNEEIVSDGYASAMTIPPNVLFANRFAALERAAREAGKGLWGMGEPEMRKPSGPIGPAPSASDPAPCPDPKIKGNVRGVDKIYHMPGGESYNETKAERMFCTEKEAQAAGFRKAKR